jgi:hypothetical protein
MSFQEAYCRIHNCLPGDYEEKLLWQCLYRHALPVLVFLPASDSTFFKEDYELIREIGPVRDPEIFEMELNRFHGRNIRDKNWIRRALLIRISGKRLIGIKNRIFPLHDKSL